MLVDPEILRVFAGQVDVSSELIRGSGVGAGVSNAADDLDGSTTQWAARLVGGHVTESTEHLTDNLNEMGHAVRGSGNDYEVTDTGLAGSFSRIF